MKLAALFILSCRTGCLATDGWGRSLRSKRHTSPDCRPDPAAPRAVEVGAETLYEAAILALKAFREHDCAPGPAAHLAIEVKSPSVRHTVVARKIEEWLVGGARSPSEAVEKRRLKELLDAK